MRQIASSKTAFRAKMIRLLGLVFLALWSVKVLRLDWSRQGELSLLRLLIWAGYVLLFVFYFKGAILDPMSSVLDDGDALVVRRGKREVRIALSNISRVCCGKGSASITLFLREPCIFGKRIEFKTDRYAGQFLSAKNPLAVELAERVEQARQEEL